MASANFFGCVIWHVDVLIFFCFIQVISCKKHQRLKANSSWYMREFFSPFTNAAVNRMALDFEMSLCPLLSTLGIFKKNCSQHQQMIKYVTISICKPEAENKEEKNWILLNENHFTFAYSNHNHEIIIVNTPKYTLIIWFVTVRGCTKWERIICTECRTVLFKNNKISNKLNIWLETRRHSILFTYLKCTHKIGKNSMTKTMRYQFAYEK